MIIGLWLSRRYYQHEQQSTFPMQNNKRRNIEIDRDLLLMDLIARANKRRRSNGFWPTQRAYVAVLASCMCYYVLSIPMQPSRPPEPESDLKGLITTKPHWYELLLSLAALQQSANNGWGLQL